MTEYEEFGTKKQDQKGKDEEDVIVLSEPPIAKREIESDEEMMLFLFEN